MKKILSALMSAGLISLFPVSAAAALPGPAPSILKFDRVLPRDTDLWSIRLLAGVTYSIVVDGNGLTDLDLYVFDENDNLVGKDIDATDACLVRITPRWSGPFRVAIKNLGPLANSYAFGVTP